jgi:hypothetical protein
MSESIVLCEGFHDRAFWRGWLGYLGCTDPGAPPPGSHRRAAVHDPWNDKVQAGQYAYHSRSGHFLRVVPCGGKQYLLPTARDRLSNRTRKRLVRLVLCVDPDTSATGGAGSATGLKRQDVEQHVRQHTDPNAQVNANGEIEVDGGATRVSLVRWEVADPSHPALPDQQALERLACSAIIAAYPARAKAVGDWLASRPTPPSADPKEHAWSYMAGWYAGHNCENFYTNLWNDPRIVAELQSRLQASGAWQIVAAMAT